MAKPNFLDYHEAHYALQVLRLHQKPHLELLGLDVLHKMSETHVEWSLMYDKTLNQFALVIPGSNELEDWRHNIQFLTTRFMPGKLGQQIQAQVARLLKHHKDQTTELLHESRQVQPHANEPGSEEWAHHKVHSGFYRSYEMIKTALRAVVAANIPHMPDCKLIVTAHSMGAAVAVFAALDIQYNDLHPEPHVYLFGAPRVGNRPFVDEYNQRVPNTVRVLNGFDVVPTVPPAFARYYHVGQPMHIGRKRWQRVFPRVSDHFVDRYYIVLDQLYREGS